MRWSRIPFVLLLSAVLCGDLVLPAQATETNGDARDDPATAGRNAVVSLGFCTGTLITDLIVLTAAHCIPTELRRPRAADDSGNHCANLPQQHEMQTFAWEDPMVWHDIPRNKAIRVAIRVAIGGERTRPTLVVMVRAYSLPRCADMALLQLVRRVPPALATPIRVMTALPEDAGDTDAFLRNATLAYAGWGLGNLSPERLRHRQTGRVSYWDRNVCMLYTLPPERGGGERVVTGDSGSPLLMRVDKRRIVAGVLFGKGLPDVKICGRPLLRPPTRHGAYTPTWRGTIDGTDATDLGAWISHFAPDAVWGSPDEASEN